MARKPLLTVLALCALPLITSPAFAGGTSLYWYNGDPDFGGELINETGRSIGSAFVFDDFVVGAGGVNITGVFSNDTLAPVSGLISPGNQGSSGVLGISTASWQIRSGVSAGNGGTLIASGDGTASFTDLGAGVGGEVYTVDVNGLNVNLLAGTYWLSVAPDISNSLNSGLSRTAGANAVGSPMAHDGNSFINAPGIGDNYAPATNLLSGTTADGGFLDFSEGVATAAASPEPGTVFLCVAAALLLAVIGRRSPVVRD
jgi:hypothetical protein